MSPVGNFTDPQDETSVFPVIQLSQQGLWEHVMGGHGCVEEGKNEGQTLTSPMHRTGRHALCYLYAVAILAATSLTSSMLPAM